MSSNAGTLAVEVIYRGVVIDTQHVTAGRGRGKYVIGSTARADAPVAAECMDGDSWTLVEASETGLLVNVTPQMTGQIACGAAITDLATWTEQHGRRFALPEAARATLVCGATIFVVSATSPPDQLPRPRHTWRWSEQRYTVATGIALLLAVLLASLVPPDANALSFDRYQAQLRFVDFVVAPPQDKPVFVPVKGPLGGAAGSPGKRAPGPAGALGDRASRQRDRRFALAGPRDEPDPHNGQQRIDEIEQIGILGLLRPDPDAPLAAVLGRETALGHDEKSVLGNLIASRTGAAYAIGGLDVIGTGAGGGNGDGVLGVGQLGTIGTRGARGAVAGYGPGGPADLPRRPIHVPDYVVGQPVVRGALDKEIIRRIIRRHINEVKFCYEVELARNQNLGGRVAVNFTIMPTGQVAAALVQSTTMGNPRVESCLVGAVRRWEFPKPVGGGVVIATYPFSFMAAGQAETP